MAPYILPPVIILFYITQRSYHTSYSFSAQLVFEKIVKDFSLYIPMLKFDPHCGPTVSLKYIFAVAKWSTRIWLGMSFWWGSEHAVFKIFGIFLFHAGFSAFLRDEGQNWGPKGNKGYAVAPSQFSGIFLFHGVTKIPQGHGLHYIDES